MELALRPCLNRPGLQRRRSTFIPGGILGRKESESFGFFGFQVRWHTGPMGSTGQRDSPVCPRDTSSSSGGWMLKGPGLLGEEGRRDEAAKLVAMEMVSPASGGAGTVSWS